MPTAVEDTQNLDLPGQNKNIFSHYEGPNQTFLMILMEIIYFSLSQCGHGLPYLMQRSAQKSDLFKET